MALYSVFQVVISEVDVITLHRDVILVVLQECEVPHTLSDLPHIDANVHGWWTKILARLALPGRCTTFFTVELRKHALFGVSQKPCLV